MREETIAEGMIRTVRDAQGFAVLGGDADEYMRFIQLEWESYSGDTSTETQKRRFYTALHTYKKYRSGKQRDWRDDFSGRNHFATIV